MRARAWLLLALGGLLVWAAASGRPLRRTVLAALDAEEVVALAAATGMPLEDLWERARTIGVGAVILRQKTLADLIERGDAFTYSRTEIEKWRAVGLVAPGVALKADVLWVKDKAVLKRVVDAADRAAIPVTTSSTAGYHLAEFPGGLDPSASAGHDPQALKTAAGQRLIALLAGPMGEGLAQVTLRPQADGSVVGLPIAGAGTLAARTLDVSSKLPAALRAVNSHPRRLLILRLSPSAGAEGNLDALRALLRQLKASGVTLGLPPEGGAPGRPSWPARGLAWLLAVIGPLLALRLGLQVFKAARTLVLQEWPIASPVPELAAGVLAAAGASAAAGLGVYACLTGASLAGLPDSLAFWAVAAPLTIGALALYSFDLRTLKRRWRQPTAVRDLLALGLLMLFVPFLFQPRALLTASGLWGLAERLQDASVSFWWWPWRWREMLLGFPCLLHALYLLERRLGCPDCPGSGKDEPLSDPRGWLLLGLLGPAGVIASVGRPGSPLELSLGQTAAAAAVGLGVGAAGIVLRILLVRWVQGPMSSRPIDPVASV